MHKNKIKLSVVIVNFNTSKLTLDCLQSIQKEAGALDFEVILVDNGSTDDSVKSFRVLTQNGFWKKRLRLILNSSNKGYAKANNQGIKIAVGKYVLLLNSDTIVHKNAFLELVNFAEKTPDAGIIGSRLLNTDGTLQMSCFRFPTLFRVIKQNWLGESGLLDKYAPIGADPVIVDVVVGASFLITSIALKKVGLLNEKYFAYFEDMDYCRQVYKAGLKVYYLPKSLITHHHGATFNKLASHEFQWNKLIPGSKIYHGLINHYLIVGVMWTSQKIKKFFFSNKPR
jgi:GT2 family glycosyltransferase